MTGPWMVNLPPEVSTSGFPLVPRKFYPLSHLSSPRACSATGQCGLRLARRRATQKRGTSPKVRSRPSEPAPAGVGRCKIDSPPRTLSCVDLSVALQGKDELFAALPALAKNSGGVAWEGFNPTLIFSEEKSDPGLGWWMGDAWDGRRITFSM